MDGKNKIPPWYTTLEYCDKGLIECQMWIKENVILNYKIAEVIFIS